MIVVWEASDRLGNRLFISAYGIALAEATGQRLLNLHLDKYEVLFPATKPILPLGSMRFRWYAFLRLLIRRLSRLSMFTSWFVRFRTDGTNSAACSPANPAFVNERKGQLFTFILGWPYLEEIIFPSTKSIREIFTPSLAVLTETADHVSKAKRKAKVLIGVHIRYGDYRTHLKGRYFYSIQEYRDIMLKIQSLFDDEVAFLVCSDEQLNLGDFDGLQVTLGLGTVLGDLYSLALCDYLIGTPSTFCLWAAFYGRKPVYMLARAEAPKDLTSFAIPDGKFDCMKTIMHAMQVP